MVDHSTAIFNEITLPIQIIPMHPMETLDRQLVCMKRSSYSLVTLSLFEGFYDSPNDFYPQPFRGRGFYRRGGYGQGGDLADQENFNDFQGYRGGRGRGRGRRFHRGSGRRGEFKNDKFVFSSTIVFFSISSLFSNSS